MSYKIYNNLIMLAKFFLLCLLAFGVHAGEEDVLELTDADFTIELDRHDNTLVMFYAPWCGHCKRLKPEYAEAAGTLKGNVPPITLAKVDCTEAGKDTCSKYGVSGYPTLKIFSKSEVVADYNGPREAKGIVKYMKAQVGPASKELKTAEDLKTFLSGDEVSIVGFFEKEKSPLADSFHSVAKKLREKANFAHTTVKSILEKEKMKNNIVLYRPKLLQNKFEPHMLKYEGGDSVSDINEFITKNYFGLCGIRTRDNAMSFNNPLVVAYYAVDYVKNPKGTNYWRNRVMKVAKDFPTFNFAISNKDDFQHELNDFGVEFSKSEKPVVLAKDDKGQKFILKDEFSVENLEKFMKDLEAGNLEPFIKSEPIPEDNSGNVKVVVAKNFDEVVTKADSDVLIEFYAPWCGHCKKLAPVFDELGDKMAKEDVVIAKMDATANDVPPHFTVQGFPTLYWVPKNSKDSPVKYEGGRELDDFVKYIAQHSTDKLKGFDRKGNAVKAPSDEL
ncbi:protein disulfide-isomerase A3 [Chelonus insularis]|uniref:protein disulfide-isomerase A3 n=1 Tax=Chelonus insularis TaxID=460826 RepID=UPI00158E3530|nr:protein disulfide-isomerase A3 [Chelonus insularis]